MNVEVSPVQEFHDSLLKIEPKVEREGLPDAERVRRAKQAFMRKLDGRKAVDLDTCLHCGMCAEACPFYETTKNEKYAPVYKYRLLRRVYRREVSPMRWLYKPFTRDITIEDLREWRHYVFDACTGCARCDMICPMGVNVSSLIRVVREGIGAADMMPPRLQKLKTEQQEKNSIAGVDGRSLRAVSDRYADEGIDIPLNKDGAEVMLLTTATELRMFPDALAANARILNKAGADWTMFTDAFEAANLGYIAGDTAALHAALKRIVDKVKSHGIRTVLVPETGHGYQVLRWLGPNVMNEKFSFDVLSILEFVANEQSAGRLRLKDGGAGTSVTYQDPCRLSRKGGILKQPREILESMGFELRETQDYGRESHCCGGGCGEYALSADSSLRHKAFELKKEQLDETGADKVVTACASCRYNLLIGAKKSGWEMPIISISETVAEQLAD